MLLLAKVSLLMIGNGPDRHPALTEAGYPTLSGPAGQALGSARQGSVHRLRSGGASSAQWTSCRVRGDVAPGRRMGFLMVKAARTPPMAQASAAMKTALRNPAENRAGWR